MWKFIQSISAAAQFRLLLLQLLNLGVQGITDQFNNLRESFLSKVQTRIQ